IIETPYRDALGVWGRVFKISPGKNARQQIKSRFGVSARKSPVDSLITLGGAIINYPCPDKNWRPFALKAARELWQQEKIEAVISSSPPVVSHLIGGELKAAHQVTWVADLRDLWSQNHNYIYGPVRKFFDRRLERKTLSKSDALVTVAEPWAEKLRSLHRGKPVVSITHGFDPAEVNSPPAKLTAKFTITYTGSIYPGKQDPVKLLDALRDLISEGAVKPGDIEVRFYGREQDWLDNAIAQHGLSDVVKQHGLVPRQVALEKQRESQLLLLLDWDDPLERGVYAGKVFEYLAARRPILATGGSRGDVVGELLAETGAGVHAPTLADIKDTLRQLYQQYRATSAVAYHGDEAKVNQYSQREMARKFAGLLDGNT
ncbi:MAG: hypothetical protein Q8O05_04730, partial [Chloroflexota bacterium]|nr:hypothetical protein [Chloroflexota bacterium]